MWVLGWVLTSKSARKWTLVTVLYALSFLFAYTQMLLMPVVALAMWIGVRRGELTIRGAVARLAWLASAAGVVWAVFVRPNTHPFLKIYWADQFPQSLAGAPEFYLLKLLQWTRVLQRSSRFEEAAWAILLAMVLAGMAALAKRGWNRTGRPLAAALAITFAVLVCTSALKLHPMGPARLLMFSFPLLMVAWLAGADRIARAAGGLINRRMARTMCRTWPAVLALGAAAYMGRDLAGAPRGRPELSDAPGFTRLLRERAQAGDLIWIHGSAVDLAEYYFRRTGYPQGHIIRSGYGLPCCVTERLTVAGVSYADEIQREFEEKAGGREAQGVWLVTLEGKLIPNFRDDGAELREALAERGCRVTAKAQFNNARVDHLVCVP